MNFLIKPRNDSVCISSFGKNSSVYPTGKPMISVSFFLFLFFLKKQSVKVRIDEIVRNEEGYLSRKKKSTAHELDKSFSISLDLQCIIS